jgi:tRNA A58 N-methylase Trm61
LRGGPAAARLAAALSRLVAESGTIRQYDTRPGTADTLRQDAERAEGTVPRCCPRIPR